MLARINLLPWRTTQRAAHQRRFTALSVLAVLLALGSQWAMGLAIDQQLGVQQSRVDRLDEKLGLLDGQLKALQATEQQHQALQRRLSLLESLQSQRNKTALLMNLIRRLIPEGVYLDTISLRGQSVALTGIADRTADVTTLLAELEDSEWLSQVSLRSIVAGVRRFERLYQSFNLTFVLDDPNAADFAPSGGVSDD